MASRFGGTDGHTWFNDVWCYDPNGNSWSQLDCIGYIPIPRDGHAAALVDDVMYVFGGRTASADDLGDLAAFRITSRRWYTFQNMGLSPSPRSGHSMTTVGKQIFVVGGEPRQASTTNDLAIAYCLDTTKIRYPNDGQIMPQRSRRPSQSDAPTTNRSPSREDLGGPPASRSTSAMNGSNNGHLKRSGGDLPAQQSTGSRLPRAAGTSTTSGPPPSGQAPKPGPASSAAVARVGNTLSERSASPKPASQAQTREAPKEPPESPVTSGRRTPTANIAKSGPNTEGADNDTPKSTKSLTSKHVRSQGSVDNVPDPNLKSVAGRPSSPPPAGTSRLSINPLTRRGSGRNSQTVALLEELDSARNRNAWYASELELARKAGYVTSGSPSPVLDGKATETFDDEDKPLIEALLAMKHELTIVQDSVDQQAILAAKQIAEAEKQRDVAIQEAVYAKAKLAAHGGSAGASTEVEGMVDRSAESDKKLAQALNIQRELQNRIEVLLSEMQTEKRARQFADETASAAQKRVDDLENYKQKNSSEVENLRASLHKIERELREQSVMAADSTATLQLLRVEKEEVHMKYQQAITNTEETNETFESLRLAISTSEEIKIALEKKLDDERASREKFEAKLTKLKAEHEARTAELIAATQRLEDVEELSEKLAKEAQTHRQALLNGLDKLTAKDLSKDNKIEQDKIQVLTSQNVSLNGLVKKYQQEADSASDQLRLAEERIAGLEIYQEQSSREGVSMRKQLQAALKDTQNLQAAKSELVHRLESQQLDTNALNVQLNALKDLLGERGINPTAAIRTRAMTSPRDSSPVTGRTRELEQQLAAAHQAHETTKQTHAQKVQESEAAYMEKLSQLESDYSSAIHYAKGLEKMLRQMKAQLESYKAENASFKAKNDALKESAGAASDRAAKDWEAERDALQKRMDALQAEISSSAAQFENRVEAVRIELDDAKRDRENAMNASVDAARQLSATRKDLEQLQEENGLLERRAQDAEEKVSLLLDQVESSIDNYRRRSRHVPSVDSTTLNSNGMAHVRQDSSDAESMYGELDARNSAALDSLATELETLRSQLEATKNYRLSANLEFDSTGTKRDEDSNGGIGLSESLADWRKRLDTEEQGNKRHQSPDRHNRRM